ncbi:MAG TPA: SpoIIE family protein phosphatase [Vicinamibacterales bacterium]|nr:SpoIIE family protein phosphatase [Vicinamibacterales bacterium]
MGFLWRVRRKLTLSYIFIGFVPILLIVVFFLLCGLLLFFNVSSYLVQSRVNALVDETRFLAEATTIELAQAADDPTFDEVLTRRQEAASARYHGASIVVVPTMRTCGPANATPGRTVSRPLLSGAWAHLDAPTALPDWVMCEGYAGLIAYQAPPTGAAAIRENPLWRTHLAVRAVALPAEAIPRYAVIVDVPVTAATGLQIQNDTGIELGDISTLGMTATDVVPVTGRAIEEDSSAPATREPLTWMTFLDYNDWVSGRMGNVVIAIGLNVTGIYGRISATPLTQIGNYSVGQLLLIMLMVVAALFLTIQTVAFMTGLSLARSITGAVHELATGTDHVRRGDFSHRISVSSDDQLGDLADSFNSMTASVEDLLHAKAEKERLEQELRIARQIQMSLLPQGPLTMDGLSVTAHCEPAREVGGDYYDYLPLGDRRVGILIADVAGKGTSAALYMAELKGLMLSLSQLHSSPRELLITANRIIAQHLDARSFITMTYAVVDPCARTLTYARAGHCPLIYLPGPGGRGQGAGGSGWQELGGRRVQVQIPDGLVLGLKIDSGERFNSLLEEVTLPLGVGDVVLLFTDGVTDAMNADGDPFGEERLAALVAEHGDLPFEELRERILRDIRAFVGDTGLQDDLTFVLLKMDNVGVEAV